MPGRLNENLNAPSAFVFVSAGLVRSFLQGSRTHRQRAHCLNSDLYLAVQSRRSVARMRPVGTTSQSTDSPTDSPTRPATQEPDDFARSCFAVTRTIRECNLSSRCQSFLIRYLRFRLENKRYLALLENETRRSWIQPESLVSRRVFRFGRSSPRQSPRRAGRDAAIH